MGKPSGAFAGIKLTDQTPSSEAGLDQRLFSSPAPPKPASKPVLPTESQEVGKEGTREVRKETSLPGRSEGVLFFDINEKPYRKDSFLFTDKEFEALEDLKLDLRRKFDLPATKNDLARCALQHVVEDYRRHGEASVVVRQLRDKRAR